MKLFHFLIRLGFLRGKLKPLREENEGGEKKGEEDVRKKKKK